MLDSLLKIDYEIFNLIHNTLSTNWGDSFFPAITDLHKNPWTAGIIVAWILFLLIKTYSTSGLKIFVFLVLCLGAVDLTGSFVKNQVQRKRPFETQIVNTTQKSPAGSKSFYSNHASNMMALAVFLSFFLPIYKIPLYILATTIAYSRVYNGVHYPSDVIAGALVGALIGWIFLYFAKHLYGVLVSDLESRNK